MTLTKRIKYAVKVLTVIPAKIGSKRLPEKNIKKLAGKPLVCYTIESAIASGVCGEIMVSTDSDRIAETARRAGARVPFMRPGYLGKDPYGVVDVCLHVIKEYENRGSLFDTLIILLPTSPFRSAEDIRKSYRMFRETGAEFLMSVSEFSHNPFGALVEDQFNPNIMKPCFPHRIGKKRHELPVAYRANGAICIVDIDAFKKAGTYYGEPLFAYKMPWQRSIDIDDESDFLFAEFLIKSGVINAREQKGN